MNTDPAAKLMAFITLYGFAAQRVLSLIEPFVTLFAKWLAPAAPPPADSSVSKVRLSMAEIKSVIMSLFQIGLGVGFSAMLPDHLLKLATGTADLPGDFWITAFVIGAGTEGANTIVKYISYVKQGRAADAELKQSVVAKQGVVASAFHKA